MSSDPLCPKCVRWAGLVSSPGDVPERFQLVYDSELDKLVCDSCGYVW